VGDGHIAGSSIQTSLSVCSGVVAGVLEVYRGLGRAGKVLWHEVWVVVLTTHEQFS
jgi:hypothetical protein